MDTQTTTLIWGLAASMIGGLQVTTIVIKVVSPGDSLTPIHCLQLIVCGCLLVTGIVLCANVQVTSRSLTPAAHEHAIGHAEHGYFGEEVEFMAVKLNVSDASIARTRRASSGGL